MNKLFFLTFVFFLCAFHSNAQKKIGGKVAGMVVERSNKLPIEFVIVELIEKEKHSKVQVSATDKQGKFIFEKIGEGDYLLTFSFLGFEKKESTVFSINATQKDIDLGTIELSESTNNLNEVVIKGEKSTYENAIDKKVFNVGTDLMSNSGSVSDLMKNIPSVQVDIEGNVSLRGSTDVLILINGKTSSLMGSSRAEVLEQIPAGSIEKIEIITNPSAKFKPDGTGGIINIVLKKNKTGGVNCKLVGNIGNDGRYNASISLNYKPGKFNIYGSYNFRQDYRKRYINDSRTRTDTATMLNTYISKHTDERSNPVSNIVRAGVEYNLNDKNMLGISGNINLRSFIRTNDLRTLTNDNDFNLSGNTNRHRYDDEYHQNMEFTSNFLHSFDKEGHDLTIELQLSRGKEHENNSYTNTFILPVNPQSFDRTLIAPKENESQLYVEYKRPLSKSTKLEAGYVWESNYANIEYEVDTLNLTKSVWENNTLASNHYIAQEDIHAFYATIAYVYNKYSMMLGLRTEADIRNINEVSINQTTALNSFQFYPSLHLSYQVNERDEWQLNYSRRVKRPSDDDLNPFPQYQDPLTLRMGNPKLQPEDIHSIELGFKMKLNNVTIIPGIYYRHKFHEITDVTTYRDNSWIQVTTKQNLAVSKAAGAELVLSSSINDRLSLNYSANGFYNQIDASNLGLSSNKTIFSWSMQLTSSLSITKTTAFQLNMLYNSAMLTPQGEQGANFVANAGLRQDLFKKKASLILSVSDVFNTLKSVTIIDTPVLKERVEKKRNPTIIYLGFSWNFGKAPKKQKDNNIQFDEKL